MDWVGIFVEASRSAIGVPAAAYALSAVGLNLQFGYTGLLNFGHVAFMLVGAYGTAITVDQGGPLWLGIVIGLVLGLILAVLIGIPTLRLRADYLAIVTIAVGEILRLLVRSRLAAPLTKGIFGIQRFANRFFELNPLPDGRYGIGNLRFSERTAWVVLVGWVLVIAVTLLVRRLVNSPWGRVIKAIREDEDAVRSLGKNVFLYKIQALMVGGAIGALAGAYLAIDQQNVAPDTYIPLLTFYAFTVVIIGGPGTIWGPLVGSMLFWFLFEFLDEFMTEALLAGWFGDGVDGTDIGPLRFMLFGIGLMWLMAYRPQGLFGSREELLLDVR
jgi:branched-chain amino acid transport system permease protein